MIKLKSITLLLFLSSFYGFNQEGFMHHKNHFDFAFQSNVPILSGSFNADKFKAEGTEMNSTRDWYDYGAYFNYYHVKSRRFSLGITAAFKNYELAMSQKYTSLYATDQYADNVADTTYLQFESLKYQNLYFGPTFEFATKDGSSGIGFTYDLAAGLSIARLINDSYGYSLNNFTSEPDDSRWTNVDYYTTSFNWDYIYGLFLRTGFKIRYPLTRYLSVYTGFNFTSVLNYKPDEFVDNVDSDVFNSEDVFFRIQRTNLITTTLDFGITLYL